MVYLTLIYEFLKVGLFSVGGGLATLPFLYQIADNYPWFTREMLVDMIAISESTPGPIGINMATYAGYAAGGVLGGVLATVSLLIPSVLIVASIVKVLDHFKENRFVKAAFYGVRPAVTALIASAALGIVKITLLDVKGYEESGRLTDIFSCRQMLLFCAVCYLMRKYNRHPVYYIAGAALAGAVLEL
ncbi:MAG: chromate transporter [Synergistaceae bacterium]|jgi:chromate transporter|nr:chromate transporter [Synergistaceae bacterium]